MPDEHSNADPDFDAMTGVAVRLGDDIRTVIRQAERAALVLPGKEESKGFLRLDVFLYVVLTVLSSELAQVTERLVTLKQQGPAGTPDSARKARIEDEILDTLDDLTKHELGEGIRWRIDRTGQA